MRRFAATPLVCAMVLGSLAAPLCRLNAAEPPSWQSLNEMLQVELFVDDSLWDDPVEEVARRLQWPEESRTQQQRSYRSYAKPEVRVLGARPYSLALYGSATQVQQLSLVFANKGDFAADAGGSGRRSEREARQVFRDFRVAVKADEEAIAQRLETVLGPAQVMNYGVGSALKERVRRWDWRGHSFLLAAPREEYTGVRVVPASLAEEKGQGALVADAELRQRLGERVTREPNGDVWLSEIPMVDQGPKGFCVPATWERYLRYLGIHADMYVLAMAGGTSFGGGTSVKEMVEGVKSLVIVSRRRYEELRGRLTVRTVAKYIDQGLPLMWSCYCPSELERAITHRTKTRSQAGAWEEHVAGLRKVRRELPRSIPEDDSAHVRMIVGYNAKTEEIAISDSWGAWAERRWMLEEEAQLVTLGELSVVSW